MKNKALNGEKWLSLEEFKKLKKDILTPQTDLHPESPSVLTEELFIPPLPTKEPYVPPEPQPEKEIRYPKGYIHP